MSDLKESNEPRITISQNYIYDLINKEYTYYDITHNDYPTYCRLDMIKSNWGEVQQNTQIYRIRKNVLKNKTKYVLDVKNTNKNIYVSSRILPISSIEELTTELLEQELIIVLDNALYSSSFKRYNYAP